MSLSIKEFSEDFGVSEYTVRYYTDIGLLPCGRDGGNRRAFDEESSGWMKLILCLRSCGATIEEIKEYCRLCRLPETKENLNARYDIILNMREKAYKSLEDAQKTVDFMEYKVKHYEDIIEGRAADDTNPVKIRASVSEG